MHTLIFAREVSSYHFSAKRLKGKKEKTASGKTKEDLMINKRGKVVHKRASAAGQERYKKNLMGWTEALMKARNELGIKGMCAVGGLQRSTSTWCSRASDPPGLVAQTDQQTVQCSVYSLGAAVGMEELHGRSCHKAEAVADNEEKKVASKVLENSQRNEDAIANNGGARSMTPLECGSGSMTSPVDYCSMTSLDADKQHIHGHLEEACAKFLYAGTELVWQEVVCFHPLCLFGRRWETFMRGKLFMLDHMFQLMVADGKGASGDMGIWTSQVLSHVFLTMVDTIATEVQIRFFIMQQGLNFDNEEVKDLAEEGSTVEVGEVEGNNGSHHNGRQENGVGVGMRSYYDDFKQRKRMRAAPLTCALGSTEDVPQDAGKMDHAAPGEQRSSHECCQVIESLEAAGACASLRGGANQFAVLEEEEHNEEKNMDTVSKCSEVGAESSVVDEVCRNYHCMDDNNDWIVNKKKKRHEDDHGEVVESEGPPTDEEDYAEEELDCSFESAESGRSFYAEFFERKAAMRGGAGGGSNASKNKQLSNALDALAAVCKSMDASQEDDSVEGVVTQITQLAKQWQEKMPTKGEMRSQLRRLHVLLEKDCQRMANPEASREANAESSQQAKQSFYGDFVQRLRQEDQKPDGEWKTKGKGKGAKGKNQQKGKKNDALPRFDLMKIWPSRAISTWQILEKELESGKEPTGSVVIVESIEKMSEYQSLASAHSLVNSVIMVARAGENEPTNVKHHQVIWLPYLSNLALARAVVATTSGAPAEVRGVEPIKKDKNGPVEGKQTTLRIIVDLWLIEDEKRREGLKQHPHAALHEVAKGTLQELKTHGWVVGEHTISGYCTVNVSEVEKVLRLSGSSATFITKLRQDVTAQPPVTWIKVEDNENTMDYYKRTQKLAADNGVALARRAGGGAFLGILKADDSIRNRAWSVSGIPPFWGPLSVRNWLQEVGWKVENNPKPPNGKFKTWAFQGRCEEHPLQMSFAYETKNGDKMQHITVQHWQKVRTPTKEEQAKEQRMRGTRWWSADDSDPIEISPTHKFEPQVAATEMDTDDGATKRTQEGKSQEASSPDKKKSKKNEPKAKPVLQGGSTGPDGSILVNLGGGGDCGWRALSYMVATHNSPKDHDKAAERIETLSRTLRAKTTSYLVQHQAQWKASWAVDPLANEVTEGGPPARDFKHFVEEVLLRERRWVCGLCLAGAALLQHCTIIVWTFRGRADQTHLKEFWHRAAVIRGKETNKPVILPIVLHHGHYFALRQPVMRKAWPKEWASTESQEEKVSLTQDMGDTKQLSAICRGGGHGEHSSGKKRRGAPGNTEDVTWDAKPAIEDEEEALLRPFEGEAITEDEEEDASKEIFQTPPRKVRNVVDELMRTFSSRRSSKSGKNSDEEDLLRICESIGTASSAKNKRKKNVWVCPICQESKTIGDRTKGGKVIAEHLRRKHYAIFLKALQANAERNRFGCGMGMVGLVKHVPFQKMKKADWKEHATFVCPYCEMALPKLKAEKRSPRQNDAHGYLMRLSKKQHLRYDCIHREEKKNITMRQYWVDYVTMRDGKMVFNAEWYKGTSFFKKAVEKGHEPVLFEFDTRVCRAKGKIQAVCKTCRKGLAAGDGGRKRPCKGIENRKDYGPGLQFWTDVQNNNKTKEVREKLGMTQQEIKKAREAAVRWCSKKNTYKKADC